MWNCRAKDAPVPSDQWFVYSAIFTRCDKGLGPTCSPADILPTFRPLRLLESAVSCILIPYLKKLCELSYLIRGDWHAKVLFDYRERAESSACHPTHILAGADGLAVGH